VVDLREGRGRIVMANAAICAMLGRSEDELLGVLAVDLLHPDDRTGVLDRVGAEGGDAWAREVRLRRPDGTWFRARVHSSFVRDDDGRPEFLITQVEDITDAYRRTTQQAVVAHVSRSALEHGDIERLSQETVAAIADTLEVTRAAFVRGDGPFDGHAVPVGDAGALVVPAGRRLNEDEEAFLSALASVLASAIRRDEVERELLHRSLHDPLTGLPNRGLLFDRLGRVMARAARDGAAVSVLFLDLDDFKNVNDSLGHDAGDRLLTEIAARLTAALRPSDVLARFGGDEFVVLCEGGSGDDHVRVAQRLLGAVAQPVILGGASFLPRVSVGVATAVEQATPSSLLRDADVALYRAKGAGKNRVEVFGAEMRAETLERVRLASDLRLALERGELSVAYQPIVSLRERRVVGVESLVRWRHPVHGDVSPARFIGLAEEDGLIVDIDAFVLARACEEIGTAFPGLGVSVNVSRRQLGRAGLAAEIASVLDMCGMAASRLTLEVTESALADYPRGARRVLREIAGTGVSIALDDFGTGQSSLSSLRDYPLRRLKLDRAFVRSLPDGGVDRSIVRAVLDLATSLDLDVVAEGVDSVAKASALWTLGCGFGQGYLFSPAVPAGKLAEAVSRIDAMFAGPALSVA
jgi:diguanylate cyclase (GGDEF)-like protein/PAS domain S-box-containing protein